MTEPIQLRTRREIGDNPMTRDPQALEVMFNGNWIGLCYVGSVSWSQPDGGMNKVYRNLCRDQIAPLFVAAPALLAALRAVEWEGEDYSCPLCFRKSNEGHMADCEIGTALRAAEPD